nr:MAG TPA: hypothetical protein [Caudoviricetes sp.]
MFIVISWVKRCFIKRSNCCYSTSYSNCKTA